MKLDAFSAVHFDRNLTQLVGLLESSGFETIFIVMGSNLRIKYKVLGFYRHQIIAKGSVLVLCTKFNVQIGAGRHISHPC